MCTGNTLAEITNQRTLLQDADDVTTVANLTGRGSKEAAMQARDDAVERNAIAPSEKDPRAAASIGLLFGLAGAAAEYTAGQEAGRFAHENAQLARKQAKQAIAAGEVQVQGLNRQARRIQGQQRASAAGQGVDVGTGSAADVQEETARLAGEDIARVRNNASLEAFGFQSRAFNEERAGSAARRAGAFRAGSTLLGAAYQSGKF